MENQHKNTKDSLVLTNYLFTKLLNEIIKTFKKKTEKAAHFTNNQLYGFGNYDVKLPNLKEEFQQISYGYVNGKYLYNKFREAASGKPFLRISKDYSYVFFKYLGYKDVYEFVEEDFVSAEQKKNQLDLLDSDGISDDYYYVCYYLGEEQRMNKGQILIYNSWKTVEMKFAYEEGNATQIYTFFGNIVKSESFIHFNTKFFLGDKKKVEGAKFVFFVGKSAPNERFYLIGTYAGYDKYDRAIAGKMILQKVTSKGEMKTMALNNDFNPLISQELLGNRIEVESNIRKNPLLFSKKSPYAEVLAKITGNYNFNFKIKANTYSLSASILPKHYSIVSLEDSIIIEDVQVTVLNKGQILNMDFAILGIFQLHKLSIYIPTRFFRKAIPEPKGNFSGIDINNNVVSGSVLMKQLIPQKEI